MTSEPEQLEVSRARASIYRDAPTWHGDRCAAIGAVQFETVDEGCDLLRTAVRMLQEEGFAGVLGPMDGDTWHRYRVVTETDGSAPFKMEPTSGPFDFEAFTEAGFEAVSHYVSSRARLADTLGAEPVAVAGVTVSPWDGENAEQLIRKLFEMSGEAFSENQFFKPIGLDAFLALYQPLMAMIDPRHVLFAHNTNGDLVGFLFGMPDHLAATGKPAAILKTYASGQRGVGHLLADSYHRRAMDMGFEEVIHALMHETNVSLERSEQHSAHVFRRYALMGLSF